MLWTKQFVDPVPHGIHIDCGWLHLDPHWECGSGSKWAKRPTEKENPEEMLCFQVLNGLLGGWRVLL